jgi:hypothetical protein
MSLDLSLFIPSWTECAHSRTAVRWRSIANGRRQLRTQCLDCGEAVGAALRHDQAAPVTADFDDSLFDECRRARQAKIEAEQEAERTAWHEWYQGYLTTPSWRAKRQRALERANWTCEGCGAAEATEVHHLTYKHAGDELLWELRAVCRECHAKCHPQHTDGNL